MIDVTVYPEQSFQDIFIILENKMLSDSTYIHYPMIYDPVQLKYTQKEKSQYNFLGRAAIAMYQFDPMHCNKVSNPRVIIGLSPKNEFTD